MAFQLIRSFPERAQPILSRHTDLFRFLKLVLIYVSGFVFFFLLFYFLEFINVFPTIENITKLDAGIYALIRNEGYTYYWYQGSTSGFFPLFPYVWKWTHLGDFGICFLNFIFYLSGIYLLFKNFNWSIRQSLCLLSIPSAIFYFLPFSESLFFLFSSILLMGLLKKNHKWILVGLFFCSITRATAMFFIPAIIGMQFFCDESLKKKLKDALLYSLTSLAGLFTVVFIQYYQTYEWFAFAKVQTKFCDHSFSLPGFPLVSYPMSKIFFLDALAFFMGIIALTITLYYFIKYLKKEAHPIYSNNAFWFSSIYLIMILTYSAFFNDKDSEGRTLILSINRYLFCTAFFYVFVSEGLKYINIKPKTIIVYFFIGFISWLLLGFGQPLDFLTPLFASQHKTTIFFTLLSAYTILFLMHNNGRYKVYAGTFLFAINMMLSVYILFLYLKGEWVA